jgi:hypothetical protein
MSEWQIATASSVTSTSPGPGSRRIKGFDGQVAAELMADRGTDFARHLSLPEACFAPHWWQPQRARKPDFAAP